MDSGRRIETGKMAEDVALEFLEEKGQIMLERNWRSGHKELDLIMKGVSEDGTERLHIVEVRSLKMPNLYQPYESIDIYKQRAVISAARSYIYQNNLNWETQFDIVSVIFKAEGVSLEYFPDAFTPIWE
ncbi:MAG: YraN family protein [Rikenellaceae bacterium]